jgi:hypothetical protein
MPKNKISYEQDQALARGREKQRDNQRRRTAANIAADQASERRRMEELEAAELTKRRRNGFDVGDRVTGRDYFWNKTYSGMVIDGDLTDGVPVLCDDGKTRIMHRLSLGMEE